MRIIKSERVHAFCQKHQQTTEHIEYLKEDGSYVYKCLECAHKNPHMYPIYGRQQPSVTSHKLEESKKQQYGRLVA